MQFFLILAEDKMNRILSYSNNLSASRNKGLWDDGGVTRNDPNRLRTIAIFDRVRIAAAPPGDDRNLAPIAVPRNGNTAGPLPFDCKTITLSLSSKSKFLTELRKVTNYQSVDIGLDSSSQYFELQVPFHANDSVKADLIQACLDLGARLFVVFAMDTSPQVTFEPYQRYTLATHEDAIFAYVKRRVDNGAERTLDAKLFNPNYWVQSHHQEECLDWLRRPEFAYNVHKYTTNEAEARTLIHRMTSDDVQPNVVYIEFEDERRNNPSVYHRPAFLLNDNPPPDDEMREKWTAPVPTGQADECCVCQERPPATIALPCRHKVVCGPCSADLAMNPEHRTRCVVCRDEITGVFEER